MIPEGFDKTISTALALGSAALGLWAHRREMAKERHRALEAAKQQHTERELKEYAAKRDFGHAQRDLDQLKANIAHLSGEIDTRLDRLENSVERLSGALDTMREFMREKVG